MLIKKSENLFWLVHRQVSMQKAIVYSHVSNNNFKIKKTIVYNMNNKLLQNTLVQKPKSYHP